MIKYFCFVLLTIVTCAVFAQDFNLYKALTYGAKVKEVLRVVDQDGLPVAGAKVWGGFQTGDGLNDFTPIDGVTDTNGVYVIEGKCTRGLRCRVTYDGYYKSVFELTDYGTSSKPVNGTWQPYGMNHTLVLNKIINPQPLVCHIYDSLKIPVYDEWIGFDLEKYDYVSPYGKGLEKDMLLRFTLKTTSREDYHKTMEVSFANNPFAGAYEMPRNTESEFQSVYHADTNATYRPSFFYSYNRTLEKGIDSSNRLQKDKYLIFRTRTKVDAEGRLVSAHYGKIYGDWSIVGVGGMRMDEVAFNSIPNDTNLEDLHTAERSRISKRILEQKPRKKKKRKSF